MRLVSSGSTVRESKIDGQDLQASSEQPIALQSHGNLTAKPVRPVTRINGQRIYFADLAEMAWPEKTEANLAYVLNCDPRTARRYLSRTDPTEPPAVALSTALAEIMKAMHRRD